MTPIKVLLVEDSPVAMGLYKNLLESSSEVQVVGTALNGMEALNLIPKVQPQVICTDLQMPLMDGMELIKQVMANSPLPILVLSSIVQKEDIDNIWKILQAGAVDFLPKPSAASASDREQLKLTLITKIKVLANTKVYPKPLS
ncbi:MAG: response regulator [Cyanosarcina radialis HA8281-LM2]|jgi:two-component system chemotaxis response regulator CheB|nr:response regulator [Cyanosarcina radialis HA8281-LM2]